MKVLVLSTPRSGSSSMGEALQVLGYRVFAGMAHNYFHDNRCPDWTKAIEAKYYGKGKTFTRDDFEKFLGQYDAVGGWFAALLAEDLLEAYPEAKVIITTRDPDKWVESWNDSVVPVHKWWAKWWWMLLLCGGKERDLRRDAEISFEAWSYGRPWDRAEQRKVYVNHNERIRKLVPKEKPLDVEVNAGWKWLCQFLGKEIPEGKPYPHAVNRQAFHAAMNMIWRVALIKAFLRVAAGVAVSWLAAASPLRYWRRVRTSRPTTSFLNVDSSRPRG